MDRDRAVADLRREGGAIITLATGADLGSPVPSCPDWTFADLIKHVGNVYNWAGTIVADGLAEAPLRDQLPSRPPDESVLEWASSRLERVTAALEAVSLDAQLWNFTGSSPGAPEFWWRRQLHETIIHRVDAEATLDRPITPVEPALAADGIAEAFAIFAGLTETGPDDLSDAHGLWIHLHATDAEDAEWTIDTTTRKVARAHMKGDVALRGTSWALMRWLWGRPVGGELETFGDLDAAESWRHSVAR